MTNILQLSKSSPWITSNIIPSWWIFKTSTKYRHHPLHLLPTPTVPAFSFPKPLSLNLKLPTPFYPNQESSSDDNSDDEDISNQSTVHPFPTPPRETDEIVVNDNVPEHQPPADEHPVDPTLPLTEDFEPVQYILVQPLLNQADYLRPGDTVLLVHENEWIKVKLDSHSGFKDASNGSLYWNYSNLDKSNPRGSYLFPNQAWGVLRGNDINLDISQIQLLLPDGTPANFVDQPTHDEQTSDADADTDDSPTIVLSDSMLAIELLHDHVSSDEDAVTIQQIFSDQENSSSSP